MSPKRRVTPVLGALSAEKLFDDTFVAIAKNPITSAFTGLRFRKNSRIKDK